MGSQETILVAQDRTLLHNFHILDETEAGMVLEGWEVKSLRDHQVNLKGAWVKMTAGEAFIQNMHIAPYPQSREKMEPLRERKLLLKKTEIFRLNQKTAEKGLTILPHKIYFNRKGRAKISIALVKGKKLFDKREAIRKKETEQNLRKIQGRAAKSF